MIAPQTSFECYILPRPVDIWGTAIISSNGETLPHVVSVCKVIWKDPFQAVRILSHHQGYEQWFWITYFAKTLHWKQFN